LRSGSIASPGGGAGSSAGADDSGTGRGGSAGARDGETRASHTAAVSRGAANAVSRRQRALRPESPNTSTASPTGSCDGAGSGARAGPQPAMATATTPAIEPMRRITPRYGPAPAGSSRAVVGYPTEE